MTKGAKDTEPSAATGKLPAPKASKPGRQPTKKRGRKTEYLVAAILAHSFCASEDVEEKTHDKPKLLVAWEGVDPATNAPWEPTWVDMCDVSVQLTSHFFHHLDKTITSAPGDGRTYVYADAATTHRLVPDADAGFRIEHRFKKAKRTEEKDEDDDKEIW